MIPIPSFPRHAVGLLAAALLLSASIPAGAVDTTALDPIPIQEGGRKKPYLVFANEALLALTGKTSLTVEGKKMTASQLVTSIWMEPAGWDAVPLILVNNLEVKKQAGFDETQKFFSHNELASSPGFLAALQRAEAARKAARDGRLTGIDKQVADIGLRLGEYEGLRNGSLFRIVPNPDGETAPWMTLDPADPLFQNLKTAFTSGDSAAFTTAAEALRTALAAQAPQFQPPAWRISLENAYQHFHPFRLAWIVYLAAGIVLAVTSLRGRAAGYTIGWVLAGLGFALQVSGLVARILIAGRPPVTNMYESIIWVAFGTVLFALIFEAIFRSRYFLLGAIPVAVVSLILADSQPTALDSSIQPLVPVLQSNFWLSTHVTTITLSYAAFALALGVGHIALGKVILGKKPSPALYNYIYRTLQVGVLLLAVGTILGGVWANYSWGRFWDWDPKETWALAALLAYLFLLHGRLAGRWGGFGLAVGAILAFQTIIMAWYGVNFVLGVGLHSYGFGSGGFGYALGFVILEVAFTAVAFVRHRSLTRHSGPPNQSPTSAPELVS